MWVFLIFPVRNKLWLNRHPFADIIVCTKGSCWLSCIAGSHTAEWQRIAVRPGLWLLLKIKLVPLLMQAFPFPVAVACWTVAEQGREYVTSLQRDIASQQPEPSEECGWVTGRLSPLWPEFSSVCKGRVSLHVQTIPQRVASQPRNSSFSCSEGFQLRMPHESLYIWRLVHLYQRRCFLSLWGWHVTEDFSFYFGGCFLFCFPC